MTTLGPSRHGLRPLDILRFSKASPGLLRPSKTYSCVQAAIVGRG